ncbi:MAG: radical SAM protein, partial [Candidatus Eremiobacteraeota bacterium]|nr:radical SAM protein [Candidatus Eremiobacteraeota bacterium]
LVTRDIDVLSRLAAHQAVRVTLSITTLRQDLSQTMEPRASTPAARLAAVRALADAGIRVGVAVAPVLPGITDDPDALAAVVRAAAAAGASHVWHGALNLGTITRDAYFAFLASTRPELVQRYERLFGRGRYAEPAYVRQVAGRVHAACRTTRFARYRALAPDDAGAQLALL